MRKDQRENRQKSENFDILYVFADENCFGIT